MNHRLCGRRILITGAGSGIGKATAELFAREGAALALLDVNDEAAKSLAATLTAHAFAVDVTSEDGVRTAVRAAAAALGGLDGIANVAGIAISSPFAKTTLRDWNRVIDVNITGPFLVCREALPFLEQNEMATIVNVASSQALVPATLNISSYVASKAALIAFSKALAYEYGPKIRVNAVCPGAVDTPILPVALREAARDPTRSPYALKRVADAIEIASAMLFLTSNESSYITGSALAVDGGRTYH
ncbi:SDR family oxidoreductase [Bradyrhizobium sp. 153]|nr:SDR family oxidoreductase [Bradyrhizobium sp. 153]